MNAAQADTALVHLAFSLFGLALVMFVQRAEILALAPELLCTTAGDGAQVEDVAALEATVQRLADQGTALIEAEAVRRERS